MSTVKSKINYRLRHRARRLALQALYTWSINDMAISAIIEHYLQENGGKPCDEEYFRTLVTQVGEKISFLDQELSSYVERDLKEINWIELAILRIAAYEISTDDVPYKVAINEALELAKEFGAEHSYKFINGVLDKLVKTQGSKA